MRIDWNDKAAVIAYATAMAEKHRCEQLVVKYPNRSNYNITHFDNPRWRAEGATIVAHIKR
jgi:hypothetical protein